MSDNYILYNDDCLNRLDKLEAESVDCIITDPPYELNFMGKGWDNAGVSFQKETWGKCLRVLKPGGYLLAFGGTRTYHRIACAIEDAGFEIRDTIMWLYGSGFPKSMDVGLAVDKKAGVKSRVVGQQIVPDIRGDAYGTMNDKQGGSYKKITREIKESQNEWKGWGTALKPSYEPIIVARKPFKGSLVDNVLENGVGGLNIDECRVPLSGGETIAKNVGFKNSLQAEGWGVKRCITEQATQGRFPANTILSYDETDCDEVCGGFPNTKGGTRHNTAIRKSDKNSGYGFDINTRNEFNDSGSAARYFMNCKYTGKDEEIWKQLLVNNAENNSEILEVTKESIAQIDVEDLLKELKSHYAKYVDNQLDLIETPIVQDIVEMLTWDFKIETSQVIRDFIINSKKCIQFLNLVQFVEKMDNIDTTQTTQNLLKLFGYVKVAITNYIQGNIAFDQKRYIYTPKASKKDRDEGLEEFEIKTKVFNGKADKSSKEMKDVESRFTTKAHNIHPTVKPTSLMQYLVRLVAPKGATILDPFMGSGSTGKAVMYENKERNADYKFIGIEQNQEYCEIAEARIKYVAQ